MTLQEKKQFDHLKALASYKKVGVGPEALLFKKMLDRRKAVSCEHSTFLNLDVRNLMFYFVFVRRLLLVGVFVRKTIINVCFLKAV